MNAPTCCINSVGCHPDGQFGGIEQEDVNYVSQSIQPHVRQWICSAITVVNRSQRFSSLRRSILKA